MEYYPQLKNLSKGKGESNQGFRKETLTTIFTAILQSYVRPLSIYIYFASYTYGDMFCSQTYYSSEAQPYKTEDYSVRLLNWQQIMSCERLKQILQHIIIMPNNTDIRQDKTSQHWMDFSLKKKKKLAKPS